MKYVTRTDAYIWFYENFSLYSKEEYRGRIYAKNLDVFLDKIFDVNEDVVEPLTEQQTYILRKKLGALDSGLSSTNVLIAKDLNMTYQAIFIKLREIVHEVLPCVIYNLTYSGSEISELEQSKILSIPISESGLPIYICAKLEKENIDTLEKLVALSKKDLNNIEYLGKKKCNCIIELVHSYNLKFKDEELKEKLKTAALQETPDSDSVLTFPIGALNLSKRTYDALTKHGINTIGDLLKLTTIDLLNIPSVGSIATLETIDKVHELELKFSDEEELVNIEDINKNMALFELLRSPIEVLNLSNRPYNSLKRQDINTLYDLVSEPIARLVAIKNLGDKSIIEIVTKVSDMGLTFVTVEDKKRLTIYKEQQVKMLKDVAKRKRNVFREYSELKEESERLLDKEALLDMKIGVMLDKINKNGVENERRCQKRLGGNPRGGIESRSTSQ